MESLADAARPEPGQSGQMTRPRTRRPGHRDVLRPWVALDSGWWPRKRVRVAAFRPRNRRGVLIAGPSSCPLVLCVSVGRESCESARIRGDQGWLGEVELAIAGTGDERVALARGEVQHDLGVHGVHSVQMPAGHLGADRVVGQLRLSSSVATISPLA